MGEQHGIPCDPGCSRPAELFACGAEGSCALAVEVPAIEGETTTFGEASPSRWACGQESRCTEETLKLATPPYSLSVFLNVPFDDEYRAVFDALVFVIHDCGFVARSAFETDDGTQVRIEKLLDIIGSSKYGIHDISRTELAGPQRLPRFNMPLELGLFMGAKRFGGTRQRDKRGLILDRDRYRYQVFCSDIAGQDIRAHGNSMTTAIKA
ncbi:MAG: hypothetical protein ACRDKS_11290, partial [Actinomycetota bacterium]